MPLRVTVTPSASFFFAGEVFTAVVTFKNESPWTQRKPVHTCRRHGWIGADTTGSATTIHKPEEPGSSSGQRDVLYDDDVQVEWAYAHLNASFEADASLVKLDEFRQLKHALVRGSGVGGGTLIPSAPLRPRTPSHNRTQSSRVDTSFTSELHANNIQGDNSLGLIPDASSTSPALGHQRRALSESHKRHTRVQSYHVGADDTGMGWLKSMFAEAPKPDSSLLEKERSLLQNDKVPIFTTPPSILGTNIVLAPGESRSFSYNVEIPADLPPAFRGRAIRVNHTLSVSVSGINENDEQESKTIDMPIRVYNHVSATGARPFYDLTNPVMYRRDEALTFPLEGPGPWTMGAEKHDPEGQKAFDSYARAVRDSMNRLGRGNFDMTALDRIQPPVKHGGRLWSSLESLDPSERPEMRNRTAPSMAISARPPDAETPTCRASVELVTRNSQKMSFDICKNGLQVAKLSLVKSAFRVGEPLIGSVAINQGTGRVLRMSIRLETHELLETSISTKTAPQLRRITQRIHAEHHESLLDTARAGFALAIPAVATPDFATSGLKLQWSLHLSFLLIPPPSLPPPPSASSSTASSPSDSYLGAPMKHVRRFSSWITGTPPESRSTSSSPLAAPAPPSHPMPTRSFSEMPPHHQRSRSHGFVPSVHLTMPPAAPLLTQGPPHLLPVSDLKTQENDVYRAVPDLEYVPVMFPNSHNMPPAPTPGPLQKNAYGSSFKASAPTPSRPDPAPSSVVLVPAKVEVVECSIPIKVYPSNTPFRPTSASMTL